MEKNALLFYAKLLKRELRFEINAFIKVLYLSVAKGMVINKHVKGTGTLTFCPLDILHGSRYLPR